LFQDPVEVRGGAAGADLADRIRITSPQTGIAADPTRARAAFRPAPLVRSAISARSSCATAPRHLQ